MPPEPRDRLPYAALGFGVAAALSSWNPLSAPFGVLVGLAALLLGVRALRRAYGRRTLPAVAVGVAFLAVLASGLVLALTAGVGRELAGVPVVRAPAREEVSSQLERAAERTREARERARAELDRLDPPPNAVPPRDSRARTR